MSIKTVIFDVGETLINEARMWRGWAAYLKVPEADFSSAFDDVIARGEPLRNVFDRFRASFDLAAARRERAATGDNEIFDARDLYPDAEPCLRRLRALGYRVGIAGNQPKGAVAALEALNLSADFIAVSAMLGVTKPSAAFFEKVAGMAGAPVHEIAYVGDRLDNDILPARAAGMATVFLLRGPWAKMQARFPEAALASAQLTSLTELPDVVSRLQAS
jgi:HAD superfamily hydrolase (TIGR01549 family)